MTQVPPTRYSSAIITLAPCSAATRAARTPPEPPPITNRSTSSLMQSPAALLRRNLVELLAQCRIGLQEHGLDLLDDAGNDRVPELRRSLEHDELLGERDGGRGRPFRQARRGEHRNRENDGRRTRAASKLVRQHEFKPPSRAHVTCHGRSTMRTPSGPAMIAVLARPMNNPCSTTPGICASRSASVSGS